MIEIYVRISSPDGIHAWRHITGPSNKVSQFMDGVRAKGYSIRDISMVEWNSAPKDRKKEIIVELETELQ